jgi:hypothetical protein
MTTTGTFWERTETRRKSAGVNEVLTRARHNWCDCGGVVANMLATNTEVWGSVSRVIHLRRSGGR